MRATDDADFSSFVAASSRRLLRGAYLITGDLAEAEDLLQTALERAYRRWPSIRRKEVPEAYVRKIVVTTAINAGRRRKFMSTPLDEQQLPGLSDQAMESLPGRAALLGCVTRAACRAACRPNAAVLRRPDRSRDRAGTRLFGWHRQIAARAGDGATPRTRT
jgi:DNA-directed RNA polymerase specialized sigma24 family protein